MRTTLETLPDIEKLKYAIECVAQGVALPTAISDFLIEHGLFELIVQPKVKKYGPHKTKRPSGKPGVRS